MIRKLLTLARWPWFRPSPADLERLAKARAEARERTGTARRQRHTDEAHRAHVRATAALLAAETGHRALAHGRRG